MTLVKFEPWHQYLQTQNTPINTEVKCLWTQQSLTNCTETFKEKRHIWQDQGLMGKQVSGELQSLFNSHEIHSCLSSTKHKNA